MKICGISDIHGNLLENIPECDVLCICGDIVPLNMQRNFEQSEHWWKDRFTKWVEKLPCSKVIAIPGNHDFSIEKHYNDNTFDQFCKDIQDKTNNKLVFLIDQEYCYDGIKFYGTPWIEPIPFQETRWAFSSTKHYDKIPECDVLLSHDNPIYNGILDYFATKAKYHLYGHWHDGFSDPLTKRYNCSRLDDMYNFKKDYKYIIIDIMTETEKKQVEQAFLDKLISQAHSNNVVDWLKEFKEPVLQQDIEDEVKWNTSAEVLESAVISDWGD